jgi:hypothetical protein
MLRRLDHEIAGSVPNPRTDVADLPISGQPIDRHEPVGPAALLLWLWGDPFADVTEFDLHAGLAVECDL